MVPNSGPKAPRTMIGVDTQGRLLVFGIEGFERPAPGAGATWFEAATWFKSLGAYNAVILDDGGSTAVWYNGSIVNTPTCQDHPTPVCERSVSTITCVK